MLFFYALGLFMETVFIVNYFFPQYFNIEYSKWQGMLVILVGMISLSIYYMPTIVALIRWNLNVMPIFLLNAVFGWTVIGWVGTLAWSFSSGVRQAVSPTERAIRAESVSHALPRKPDAK